MMRTQDNEEQRRIRRNKELAVIAFFRIDSLHGRLALKGGNALELFYPVTSGRGSLDIDFSLRDALGDEEIQQIRQEIERELIDTFRPEDLVVFDVKFDRRPPRDDPAAPEFWGGYKAEFKVLPEAVQTEYRENLDKQRKMAWKCQVDISRMEYIETSSRVLLEGSTVVLYTPAMIVAEKLRAICQQLPDYLQIFGKSHTSGRARDFFDIHRILNHTETDVFTVESLAMIRCVFQAKQVPLELLGKIESSRALHAADFPRLRDTVKADISLDNFGIYFDAVVDLGGRLLHALGHE